MLYVKKDKSKSFYIEFKVDQELVVPDTDSVTATLTKPDGTILSGYDELAVSPDSGASFVVLDVASGANSKDNDFELRNLEIYFEYNSKPFTIDIPYKIVDRTSIPVSFDEVRLLMGLSIDELPDHMIDIIRAYEDIQLEDQLEGVDIDSVLEGGTSNIKNLLEAVKYRAALNIIPAIELLAVQSVQADNVSFRRFEEVDFKQLRDKLYGLYTSFISGIADENDVTLTYATTAVGTDAVTGE